MRELVLRCCCSWERVLQSLWQEEESSRSNGLLRGGLGELKGSWALLLYDIYVHVFSSGHLLNDK